MGLGLNKYEARVVDERSLDGFSSSGDVTSGCLVFVYDAGTKTLSTLYADANGTSLANPITRAQFATDGKIKFYSASSSHDVFIAHEDGSIARHLSVTPQMHALPLDRGGVQKCLIAAFGASDNVETDTGLDLPYGVMIDDCRIQVVTEDATETLDVGLLSSETAGDADGLLAAVSVATAGFPALVAYTTGSNETYLSSCLYGALLASKSAGNDVATDVGSAFRHGHIVTGSNAKSLTYTGSAGSNTAAGYIYVYFRHIR